MIAPSDKAIQLFHRGVLALSQIEKNGILIDEKYLTQQLDDTAKQIAQLESELKADKIFKLWRKRFGDKTNLGSKFQLEKVIFDGLGHKRTGRKTESDQHASDESAFEFVGDPFVKKYFQVEKMKKAKTTYLQGIQREISNGYIHPMEDLHTVMSYRSSSSRPNIQNMPVRNEEIGNMIRRCVIAPKGYMVGEIDYSAIEVRIAACYNKDPKLINYIEDPTTDMHRDMAMQCYILDPKEVEKKTRYCAKNKFVFPQFYGSYYIDCARSLWDAIDSMELKTAKGLDIKMHLKGHGIRKLGKCEPDHKPIEGTFEYHIQQVEQDFWNKRFKVYKEWKWDWWNKYVDRGYMKLKTGFVIQGLIDRKQCINTPIQGSAFHCLLWSLIRLQDWLNENRMKTKIVAEIHDSMLIYFYKKELNRVLAKARQIMTEEIRKHWKWIFVPLEIEAEIAPLGGSWADKVKYEL